MIFVDWPFTSNDFLHLRLGKGSAKNQGLVYYSPEHASDANREFGIQRSVGPVETDAELVFQICLQAAGLYTQ